MKRNINIMIKPASSLCNLRCKYCFYYDIAENREIENFGLLQHDVAEKIIKESLDYVDGGSVNFAFQGGEPLIWGVENFQKFIDTVNRLNVKKSNVSYALQTNGTLITKEYAKLFQDNKFLIGISVDGDSKLHNEHRLTKEHKGTFNKVMQGVDLLKAYKVDFNALIVVTKAASRRGKSIYNFYTSKGIEYIQFITCLDPMGEEPFGRPYSLDNEGYFTFYRDIFDCYLADKRKGKNISIRYFDNLLNMIYSGGQPELCGMSGVCAGQLIIEGNGNCYPCDFYCEDQHLLGNIMDYNLEELSKTENMKKFVMQSYNIHEDCKTCDVGRICRGGCRRERDYMSDGNLRKNVYCEGRQKFFRHIIKEISNTNR